jgi:hypothetical protein
MAALARWAGSAAGAAGRAATTMIGAGLAGALVNWSLLLGASSIPMLAPFRSDGEGPLPYLGVVALFGIAFPLAWLIAAQPLAAMSAARHFFTRHRDDVLAGVSAALDGQIGAEADAAEWSRRIEDLGRAIEESQPAVLRPLVRFALRRSKLEEIKQRMRSGNGPVPERLAAAIVEQLDGQLEGGRIPLAVVAAVNVATAAVVLVA